MKTKACVFISGRVQGVSFRSTTKRIASNLGLNGFVRNLPDGRVEAVFEGDEDKVEKAIDFCKAGPSNANVEKIEIKKEEYAGEFKDFQIKYD